MLSDKPLSNFSSETSSRSQAEANTVSTPLAVDHTPPDPEGAKQQTINMVFAILIFRLTMSLVCGSLYNIPGVPSIVGAVLYFLTTVVSLSSQITKNLNMSMQIETLHAQMLAHRAKGLGNGARLGSNSHSTVSNSSNGLISSPANAYLDVPSSTGQDPASISHHSNEPESIPLQILTPAPASTTSVPISRAAPERSTSMTATPFTPSTSVSAAPTPSTPAQPEIIEQHNTSPTPRSSIYTYYNISSSILLTPSTPRPTSQSPNASPISPLDDGRLYRDPPHRHDTEADIGVVPITSLSSRSNNESTSAEMCPEPEDIQHGVASGVDSGDANISGQEGVRRRGTAELPSSSSLPDGRSREH